MGMKQNCVIVNEYTIKNKSGKGGSRGGTPGDYVLRYMARIGAVEDLTPVRLSDTDSYITRYMARQEATETCDSVPEIKKSMKKAQGLGGIAFGGDDLSMSDEKLRAVSKDIQKQFDNGKTCLKTVLSFDEKYLKKMGIIAPDFEFKTEGDYRGNIDQMKLRMAITEGIKKMSKDYDDLEWVGTIQVDTGNVHCHLCMADKGRGTLAKDGTQKGKISEKSKRNLRRGIDNFLDGNQTVKMMSSNITHDKRNALCYIKKFTHKTMDAHGTPQFLLACLPDDKRLWRAGTNNKQMKKANAIVREYVEQILSEPDSGFREAMRDVTEYASHRTKNEDLTGKEYRGLIQNGRERIVSDCMNGVYAVLKQIPDTEKQVRTPMLDVMSADYEVVASHADKDPMIEFGFKLRSYSSRLKHHKDETHKYRNAVSNYENTKDVSEDSKPMYEYFKFEADYNAKLMCKYQHFLSFLPPDETFEDDFKDLMDYRRKVKDLERLRDDPSVKRMKPESAEDYGLRVYNQRGGRHVVSQPQIIENRLDLMHVTYTDKETLFREKLADYGMTLNDKGVSTKKPYEFHEVKALDIHHLGYDFSHDISVSKLNADEFIETANKRYELFSQTKAYLKSSGQGDMVSILPEADVELMKEVADKMTINPVLVVNKPSGGKIYSTKTVPLDMNYEHDMKLAVKSTVQSVQLA